ncbi:Ff.00g101470.m01.CDS01 [Fusarium sp. VM40]|nr:Ff.00g101470.m01.CDS01 [Fusarium sp. VM40]
MSLSKPAGPKGRKYWLDNLRVVMTTIVIINHTGAAYGGGGGNHRGSFAKTSPILLPYVAFHYAYGLGQYFWLSGNLTAKSLSKGSWTEFVKSKLLRLGLPSLLYSVFLEPLQKIATGPGDLRENLKNYWRAVLDHKGWKAPGGGTVWYTMTLLMFDLCAVLLTRCLRLFKAKGAGSSEFLSVAKIYGHMCRWGWLVSAGTRFLVSTKFPMGTGLPIIHVQPYFLPQHIYGYVLGYMASVLGKSRMTSLYEKNSGPLGKLSLAKASAISLALIPVVMIPSFLRDRKATKKEDDGKDTSPPTQGGMQLSGWTADAALFALWNEFTFATVGPAFMSLWEHNYNKPGKQRLWSPRYAYAAYLLHSPISWFVDRGLYAAMCRGEKRPAWMDSESWQNFGPVVMTATAGYIEVAAAFGAGMLLIDYVPGAGSIL